MHHGAIEAILPECSELMRQGLVVRQLTAHSVGGGKLVVHA